MNIPLYGSKFLATIDNDHIPHNRDGINGTLGHGEKWGGSCGGKGNIYKFFIHCTTSAKEWFVK